MSTSNEVAAMRLALEALEWALIGCGPFDRERNRSSWDKFQKAKTAIKALEEALAKQEQSTKCVGEPVGEMQLSAIFEGMVVPVVPVELPVGTKLYTTPYVPTGRQQRNPLTDEQKLTIAHRAANFDWVGKYLDAVEFVVEQCEAAHGIYAPTERRPSDFKE